MNLTHLGWNSFYIRAFEPYRQGGCRAGRVSMTHHGICRVITGTGECIVETPGCLLDEDGGAPLVGDWVALGPAGMLEAVLPRRTVLERKQPGTQFGRQKLAANADVLLIVTGLDGDFSLRRIERYLVLAEHSGMEPLLVLSKADLIGDAERRRAMETVRGLSPGTPVVLWSAFDPAGIPLLDGAIGRGRTAVLAGSSGVGKSTMVNRLLGCEALATGPVREGDSRGRHTTTRRQLVPLPQGWVLIDMPGLREVQLWVGEDTVESVFAEIQALAAGCRFRDCAHASEPGCAVQAAVAGGALDAARLAQFHQFKREAAYVEAQQDIAARLERKRRAKARRRAVAKLR